MSGSAKDSRPQTALGAVAAALPANESQRLAALHETAVLDTAPEQTYDDLTALAAHICGTPIALISLVDTDRQWFKSRVGLGAAETPRELAFCAHALLDPEELFEVADATRDKRFAGNPLVTTQPDIRFYAGTPLLSEEGFPLGTLCVIDRKPRQLDEHQRASLRTIGRLASQLLRNRRHDMRLRQMQERFRAVFEQSHSGFAVTTLQGEITEVNDRFCVITGRSRDTLLASNIASLTHPDDVARNAALLDALLTTGEPFVVETRYLKPDGSHVWVRNHVSPLDGPDGKPVAVVAAVEDIDERKLLERRLGEVEDRFIRMAQDAPLKMWITDASGGCIFINKHWCEFVGHPMETQLGLGWATALHPDDIQAAGENFMAASTARRAYRKEFRLRRHDGTFHWHIDAGQPRFDDDGAFLGYIGSVVDVQDQHETSERLEQLVAERTAELAESKASYRALADDSPAMINRSRNEAGWPTLYASKSAEQITGYTADELMAEPLLYGSLMLPEDIPVILKTLAAQQTLGPDIQVEYRIRHKDGSIRWIEGTARLNTQSGGSGIYEGVNIDITARKDAERLAVERADALERATLAIQAARIAPFSWYIERDFVETNTLGETLHGMTDDDADRSMAGFTASVHPDDREALAENLRQLVVQQQPEFVLEYRTVSQLGRVRWVRNVGSLITTNGVLHTMGAVVDATIEVEVQRALEERTREMERANTELDEFTYIASHDLKEPLRGIHNYARFIAEDYADKLDAGGQHMLKAVSEQAERMQRLIEDLLEIARLGREPMKQTETDLDKLVDEVLASLSFSLAEKKVELRKQPLGRIVCDRVRVGEVFRNLITNALKYNDKPLPVIEIGSQPASTGETEFYVRDNGIGIKPDFHARVFAPFKRLHAKDAYGGGSGVGLAIVKRIVEAHGGHIGLRSALGTGATFAFTLKGEHLT